jgi:LysR family transcriptional regulator for metE and metH
VDLEVRHLRLVAAVAAHGSLTKAGASLHLTQSALSHQLVDIEDRLGARLFHRQGRHMRLTPAGDRLLESARSVLAELRAAEDAIRSGLGAPPVPLRLTTECYTCYHWLPAVLRPFKERFPRVEVHIDAGAAHEPLLAVLDGRLDLAITSTPIKDGRLVARQLFVDEHVAIVALDHPWADRPFVRLRDFRRERLLSYVSVEHSHFVTRVLQPAGAMPASVEPVQLTEAMIEIVKAGHGVAVLARWAVDPHLRGGALRALPITPQGFRKTWYAVMPKEIATTDYAHAFVELLIAHAPARQASAVVPFHSARKQRLSG